MFTTLLTFGTSIKLSSHRNVCVPTPRKNANETSFDRWVDNVLNYTVLIPVSLEVLE